MVVRDSAGPAEVIMRALAGFAGAVVRGSAKPARVIVRTSAGPAEMVVRASAGPVRVIARVSAGPAEVIVREGSRGGDDLVPAKRRSTDERASGANVSDDLYEEIDDEPFDEDEYEDEDEDETPRKKRSRALSAMSAARSDSVISPL
ncbi:hypothetical protein ACFQX6_34670 [Streptosporangium lutulentum]